VIGTNPSKFTGDDNLPVERVSWWEAIKYCNALSAKAGLKPCYNESTGDCDFTKSGFRLPTEAEWEYACRAGTTTNYYTGNLESDLTRAGWYSSNSSGKTHLVGRKTPNAWGLYDMHGNVYERVADWYDAAYYRKAENVDPRGPASGTQRVARGGSWDHDLGGVRCAVRVAIPAEGQADDLGFRVVMEMP
jgi:formylglycine-generating enzyme required for sulfatase activity